MVLNAITNEEDIRNAQNMFATNIKYLADRYSNCTVGYLGGNEEIDLFWHPKLKFWYGNDDGWNRHWNIFGTSLPRTGGNHKIVCEINVPFKGRNNSVQGVFVTDRTNSGKTYVVHQGKLTITGKEAEGYKFLEWVGEKYGFDSNVVEILWEDDDQPETKAIMVTPLDDVNFLRHIKDFIVKAANFKAIKRGVYIRKKT